MINQSNYIPWKGYIDSISLVDEFVVYDCVQYTKNDWRNRNKIKTPKGVEWITIPVSSNFGQSISDAVVSTNRWNIKHLKTISANYSKAVFFDEVYPIVKNWYNEIEGENNLSKINLFFLKKILDYLFIKTRIIHHDDIIIEGDRNERLLNICKQRNCTDYFSGPAAKCYLDVKKLNNDNINVHWFDFSNYKQYNQCWGGFDHAVSIFDMFFNLGIKETKNYLKYGNRKQS